MRTFIAIDLDEEIKKAISEFIQKLDRGDKHIRWIKPQGMHLTLKFLGDITKEKISDVESALSKTVKDHRPFQLSMKGTGTFPPGKKFPRVLWIGVEENNTLEEIQSRLESDLERLHYPREKRKYHPHLTLGRVKIPYHLESVLALLDKNKEREFGDMSVNRITLFLSTLKPTGAEYTKLSEYTLE
jgi:2'-5' RNA ligase